MKFGQQVVDVQEQNASGDAREPGGKDQKIRHGMDMDEVVSIFPMPPGKPDHCLKKESESACQMCPRALLVASTAVDTKDVYPVESFGEFLPGLAQTNHVNAVTASGERLRITDHPVVSLIEAVR